SFDIFFDSIQRFFQISEVVQSLFKSMVFGGVTSLVGCHVGFRTEGGAEGVGRSTVEAFTISAATILILDAIFGYIF
ncbi:MAG: ABC transporter permease, partial [Ignavibacteria bacterium]